MSTKNGTTQDGGAVNVSALIQVAADHARKREAGEATRQQEAVDDSLRQENESLKAKVVKLEQQLAESKRASKVIADDPKHVKIIEELLGSDLFARHLITGDGELVDLKALSRRLDEQQISVNGNRTTQLPATPPTSTQPGPPTSSDDDKDDSRPGVFKRAGGKVASGTRWVLHKPEPASSGG